MCEIRRALSHFLIGHVCTMLILYPGCRVVKEDVWQRRKNSTQSINFQTSHLPLWHLYFQNFNVVFFLQRGKCTLRIICDTLKHQNTPYQASNVYLCVYSCIEVWFFFFLFSFERYWHIAQRQPQHCCQEDMIPVFYVSCLSSNLNVVILGFMRFLKRDAFLFH